jgi:DNA-binding XRE family transcriptional regulator
MKEITVREHLQQKLKDPYFKELHELEQQKFGIVRKLIDYRIKHSLSQTDLAEKVGVSQQHISKIENGEFSSVATLERVLLGIGMTVRMEAVKLQHPILTKRALAVA